MSWSKNTSEQTIAIGAPAYLQDITIAESFERIEYWCEEPTKCAWSVEEMNNLENISEECEKRIFETDNYRNEEDYNQRSVGILKRRAFAEFSTVQLRHHPCTPCLSTIASRFTASFPNTPATISIASRLRTT